ncbi:MAG: hypothetical protein HQL43_00920 [Alphaproteobacteria bacterium]|nr:hypothetical protein [Alphaproteobacteria bacterium]
MNGEFARIELVSHPRHLDKVQEGSLIVSSDWITYHLACRRGFSARRLDALLAEWPQELGDPAQHHIRVCEWMYDEHGQDMTRFEGVSLGKLFVRSVTFFSLGYGLVYYGLSRLLATHAASELVVHDVRLRHDLLSDQAKLHLAERVASLHGVRVVSRLDSLGQDHPDYPEFFKGSGAPQEEKGVKAWLRQAYAQAIEALFRLRASRRKRVLLMLGWIATRQILDARRQEDPAPILIANMSPKAPGFLWESWKQGTVLAALPRRFLKRRHSKRLDEIRNQFSRDTKKAVLGPVEEATRSFVSEQIFGQGWLEQKAREVLSYLALFDKHCCSSAVIGDSTNDTSRIIAEIAKHRQIPVDEMLNGMFLTSQRYDSRSGDSFTPPVIDRILTRGSCDERWIGLTKAKVSCQRVGYPALACLKKPAREMNPKGNALILPIYADCDDVLASLNNIFDHLTATVDALKAFGCAVIRIKLHVGLPNLAYYKRVLETAGIDVAVTNQGGLLEHLDWADFVVGPVNSGAMLETMATGKPYYPFLPEPSLIAPELIDGVSIFKAPGELVAWLREGRVPDAKAALEFYASSTSLPDTGRAFWKAMHREAA